MRNRHSKTMSRLLCGSAALALSWGGLAQAEERAFDIRAQPLASALMAFGNQSGHAVMAPMELKMSRFSGCAPLSAPRSAIWPTRRRFGWR